MDPIQLLYTELNKRVHSQEYGAEFKTVANLLHVKAKTQAQEKLALKHYIIKEHTAITAIAAKRPALKASLKNMDFQEIGYLLVEHGAKKSADMIEFATFSKTQILPSATQQKTSAIQEIAPLDSVLFAEFLGNSSQKHPPTTLQHFASHQETSLQNVWKDTEQIAKVEFSQKYAKDNKTTQFSGVVGIFASQFYPMIPTSAEPNIQPSVNTQISQSHTIAAIPLANVQYVHTFIDKTNLEDAKQFGDKARTTTEAAIAGSWRFHRGFEQPLLLTPRRASIAQNLPLFKNSQDEFGIEHKKHLGTFNFAAGLIPNDPLLTSTRDKIYPNTKPIGDCACVGGLEETPSPQAVERWNEGLICEAPKPEMRKPNSTLLAFNPDSAEFGIVGLGANYATQQWRLGATFSPKGLPKFNPSPWNELPQPITNVFAGNIFATYKPKDNILVGAQLSTFGPIHKISLIGRTFWKNGTNAALAFDYGTMPNRTKNAVIEPMGHVRMSLEAPIGKSLDIATLGSVGRYYDSKTNFAGLQLNATYNPDFNLKYPIAFNISADWDSRYKTSINAGVIMNVK